MPSKLRVGLPVLFAALICGAALWALAPTAQAARDAAPLLRRADLRWVLGAALCQGSMYAALAHLLQTGLGAAQKWGDGNADAKRGKPNAPRPGFWFLLPVGAAFLWASRALPGPALAGIATLTFLFRRKNIAFDTAQAVAATFFLADYAAFLGLGLVLFIYLALQNRLAALHPALLFLAMALIVAGFALFALVLHLPDFAAQTAQKAGQGAARLLRRPPETARTWGHLLQNAVRAFYARWREISARRQTLLFAALWAGAMHLFEAATVFCAARAFGSGARTGLLLQASGAGYVSGNLAAIVSFLPAGLGFFEGAMGAALHYLGGLSPAQAALTTLLYRLLSVWLPLPFALGVARQALASAAQTKNKKRK